MGRLTATGVKQVKEPGRHGDGRGGHGLTLVVTEKSAGGLNKSWVQRIRIGGRETNIGLGAWPVITLAVARQRALENARTVAAGGDPRVSDRVPTLRELAEQTMKSRSGQWRGERNEAQWRSSLDAHAASLMDRPVDKIGLRDIRRALQPIWTTKEETARRVRQRIHIIMRRAVAEGHRRDNPAGPELMEALGPQSGRRGRFRSLHHSDVAAAIGAVKASQAHSATKLALEFLALTAARPGEVYGCRWDEIDLTAAT